MMFFKVILRNPNGIEAAVNLAAMFIHFQKQKAYIVTSVNNTLTALEYTNERAFNERMTANRISKPERAFQLHC